MTSMQTRFARMSVVLLIAFSLLLALFLDRTFRRTLITSEENRLKGLTYSLLSVMDVGEDGSVQVSTPPESITNAKNLSIVILDEKETKRWSLGEEIATPQLFPGVGDWFFQHLRKQNHAQELAFGLSWESENERAWRYTIILRDSGEFYRAEMHRFRQTLSMWLVVSCGVLLILQLLLLRLGFKPLQQIAFEIEMIEKGKQHKFENLYPSELEPLTTSINSLLKHERSQQTRYQQALDNLAHALKTPLTAIKNISQQKTINEQSLKDLDEQIKRAKEIVDYQLRKAATVGKSPFAKPVGVLDVVEKISRSIQKVYAQKQIAMDIQIPSESTVSMDEGDFLEMVGNVFENAAKFCKSKILVSFEHQKLSIEDDGPGFGENTQNLIQRGVRQDQRVEGSGIGLSVAYEIITASGGNLELSKSPSLGGAQVTIHFSL